MNAIEIIGIVAGIMVTSIIAILGGMRYMLNQSFQKGADTANANSRIDKIEKEQTVRSFEIDVIKRWIIKRDVKMVDGFAPKNSPRQLNDLGRTIIEVSGAALILTSIGNKMLTQMEEKIIKTAFDAETEAYFVMLGNENDDAYIPLKNYIYNQPSSVTVNVNGEDITTEISYDAIVRATSIALRDMYLDKHPEIKQ